MKPTDRINWHRLGAGEWHAELLNRERTRALHFAVERISKRAWNVYKPDDTYSGWSCVAHERTWRDCRKYVAGYFSKWINSEVS